MIYLDYNASAPLKPGAKEVLLKIVEEAGNPSSPHKAGRQLRSYIDETRKLFSSFTGAKKVVFTSGGTEANGLVLKAFATGPLLVSEVEHDCVLKHAEGAHKIPVTSEGVVNLGALEKILDSFEAPGLLSIMCVNNETGVIQPVKEAAQLAHAKGWKIHTDACQAVGAMPLTFEALGVDIMTLSSHKCGGPIGVGAVLFREDAHLQPVILGGGQEFGMRSGTQSAALIAAFGKAFKDAVEIRTTETKRLHQLQQELESCLSEAIVYGKNVSRASHVSCLGMPGVPADLQLMAFDLAGIAVSAGSACSSGKMKDSHVLQAMDLPEEEVKCAIRVSMGWKTKTEDIQKFVETWKHIYSQQSLKEAS